MATRLNVKVVQRPVAGHLLTGTARLRGTGVFTGQPAKVAISPGGVGRGIVFVLSGEEVPAVIGNARDYPNCSGLGGKKGGVLLVEHVLSALYGLGVYDAVVTVDGPEIPLFDGSALPFVKALTPHLKPVRQTRPVLTVTKPFTLKVPGKHLTLRPAHRFEATYQLDHPAIPLHQKVRMTHGAKHFTEKIAPARTFITLDEARALQASGILKGGSRKNAVVLEPDKLASMTWRVPKEPARHKLLDLIGDLALVGLPLAAAIEAVHTGHTENRRLAGALGACR